MSTDVTDSLRHAFDGEPPPVLVADALIRGARRRHHRHQAGALGAVVLVVAAVLGAGSALVGGGSTQTVLPAQSPPTHVVRVGGATLQPVLTGAAVARGAQVRTERGQVLVVPAAQVEVCVGGTERSGSGLCSSARPGRPELPVTFVVYQDAPLLVVGLTTLRPTYGVIGDATQSQPVHIRRVGAYTLFWAYLTNQQTGQQQLDDARVRLATTDPSTGTVLAATGCGPGDDAGSVCDAGG